MKRNSKLLAFVIAFAMVLSLAVVPVSADNAVNMVGAFSGINADGTVIQTPGVKAADGADPNWETYGVKAAVTLTYNEDDGSISVSRPCAGSYTSINTTDGILYKNLGLESGHTYEISCEIMADTTLDEAKKAYTNIKNTHFTAQLMYMPLDADGKEGSAVALGSAVSILGTYGELKATLTMPEATGGEYGVSLRFKVGAANAVAHAIPYRIKNVSVYDVTPADDVEPCVVTTDVANYASGVSVNPTIKYTFSNPMPELTAANFVVSGDIVPTVTKNEDGSYDVALSGLAKETEYTITLTDVKDEYEQSVANTLTFLTEGFRNYDFETFTVDDGQATSYEYTTVDGEVYDGAQSLKIVTDGGKTRDARFTYAFKGIEPGEYIISFYAKAAADSTNKVKVNGGSANQSGNTVNVEMLRFDEVDIVDTKWTKVTGYIKVKANAGGTKNQGIHVGAAATNAGTYYVDNFEIHEASKLDVDEAIVSLANTNKDNGLELTLYSAEAKTIYFAAAKYADGQLSDIKLDTVELTGAGTQTVTLSGVTDEYKIFVWDSNLTPLNSVLSLSDF